VLAYLGRYTHRVAISNSRLVSLTDDSIAFRWKDYCHHDKAKVMALAAFEFIWRFLLHTRCALQHGGQNWPPIEGQFCKPFDKYHYAGIR
jgi:hypothetical protein